MTRLVDGLEMRAIAEGVETEDQAQLLERLGCRLMQGFVVARPMSAMDATRLLEAKEARAAPYVA